ncbi:hypothetical protein EV356DRAFT_504618 [Viridothelium virens]|uniref:Uncharacterized protein n=1 Tax=Viridothelium virens TaxID=1048519 RepID=A0A6A6H4H3_VIRVR|nr:hypothetical protein EV356DRAFT_504618 [Viridothelium virens]
MPRLSNSPEGPNPAPMSPENSPGNSRDPQSVDPALSTADLSIQSFDSDLAGINSLLGGRPSTSSLNNVPSQSHKQATSEISDDPLASVIPHVFASSTDSLDTSIASLGSQPIAPSEEASKPPNPDPSGQVAGVIGSIFANGNPSSRPNAGLGDLPSPESVADVGVASIPSNIGSVTTSLNAPTSIEASQALDPDPLKTGTDLSGSGQAVKSGRLPSIEGGQTSAKEGTPNSWNSPGVTLQGQSNLDAVQTIMFSKPEDPAYSAIASPSTPLSGAVFTASGGVYTALKVHGSRGSGAIVVPSGSTFVSLPMNGPAATFEGQAISAAPVGIIENGNTHEFAPTVITMAASALAEVDRPQAGFTLSGTPHTAFQVDDPGYGGAVVIPISSSSLLLSPGGPPATIGREVISAASNGLIVESNTDTYTASSAGAKALFTISGKAYSAFETTDSRGDREVVIRSDSKFITLVRGGAPTRIGEETVSALSDGLLVGSSTERFGAHSEEMMALFTISGHSFTAFEIVSSGHHSEFIIAANSHYQTLVEGCSSATIGGETVSVANGRLVVGGYTEALITTTGVQLPSATNTGSSSPSTTDLMPIGSTLSADPPVVTSAGNKVNMATLMIHIFPFFMLGITASL